MTLVEPPQETRDEYRLGLDEGGWLIAEQMVVARYLMYIALYYHKTKRAYEHHLEAFMEGWLRDRFGDPSWPTAKPNQYVSLTDSVLWAEIWNPPERLALLAEPFRNRNHLRLAREMLPMDFAPAETESATTDSTSQTAPTERRQGATRPPVAIPQRAMLDRLREEVRTMFGEEAWVDLPERPATKFFSDPGSIGVRIEGSTRHLAEISEITRGMPERIWRARVYAAPARRDEVRQFCDQWLRERVR